MAIFICSAIMTIIISSTYNFTDPGWINAICWILLSVSSTLGINDFFRNGVMFKYLSELNWNENKEKLTKIVKDIERDIEKNFSEESSDAIKESINIAIDKIRKESNK
jgi:hypothetical protein